MLPSVIVGQAGTLLASQLGLNGAGKIVSKGSLFDFDPECLDQRLLFLVVIRET
jgi:hypothetical protein